MLSTTVLDTAIGLVFTFLAVSLAVGAATEALASLLKWRSSTLLDGVKALLNDPGFNGLALAVYKHALVNPRADGTDTGARDPKFLPAYIDPQHFAVALTDAVGISGKAADDIQNAIGTIQDPQMKRLFQGICDRTNNNLAGIEHCVARWFDSAMDRVSGAYKRKTQLISFLIALAVAVVLNVSAIRVGMALWDQPALAKTVAARPNETAASALQDLEAANFPIGWASDSKADPGNIFAAWPREGAGWWITTILGWLITAGATLFGAPFWYDTLQQFVRLKGAGPSPAEKKSSAAAAA